MHILVDENLPQRLVPWLKDKGAHAVHVLDLGLGGASDAKIWGVAEPAGAYVMTRDSDFLLIAKSSARGGVIRLQMGQSTTAGILARLEILWPEIEAAYARGERIIEVR
jgi:predicted nuclease of predicted toxin-antitoxin system